jgi:hypothetical protein
MDSFRRLLAISILVASVGTACAGLGAGAAGGGIDHPTGSDDLILRVHVGGGFVPIEYSLREIPFFSLYGDGRMVTVGPQIEIYPGPALPNLQVTGISEEGIQAILEAARDAGLFGPDTRYDHPGIADASTTTFTIVAEGRRHVISAYALGFDEPSGLIPADELEARRALFDFQSKLGDLRSWLPEGSVGEEGPFTFDELRIFVREGAPRSDEGLDQQPKDWPLGTPLSEFGAIDQDLDLRCGSVAGQDLATLLPAAQESNELTPWRSDGLSYQLVLRPLLPDESGCDGAS